MASHLVPPVVQQVAAKLSALEKTLVEEVPDTMVAVTWARCPWDPFDKAERNRRLPKDPFAGSEKTSYVAIDGEVITDPAEAQAVLQTRYIAGHRQQDTTEKMVIGTYWQRYYYGGPEKEKKRPSQLECAECAEEKRGDSIKFTSIINDSVAPTARVLFHRLLVRMNHFYQLDPHKAGFSISVIPPHDRQDLIAVHGLFCEMASG